NFPSLEVFESAGAVFELLVCDFDFRAETAHLKTTVEYDAAVNTAQIADDVCVRKQACPRSHPTPPCLRVIIVTCALTGAVAFLPEAHDISAQVRTGRGIFWVYVKGRSVASLAGKEHECATAPSIYRNAGSRCDHPGNGEPGSPCLYRHRHSKPLGELALQVVSYFRQHRSNGAKNRERPAAPNPAASQFKTWPSLDGN